MGVAAEVPQCSAPQSPRDVDRLSQRSPPAPPALPPAPPALPPPAKKYALLTPASCKPQQTSPFFFFFAFVEPLSDNDKGPNVMQLPQRALLTLKHRLLQ